MRGITQENIEQVVDWRSIRAGGIENTRGATWDNKRTFIKNLTRRTTIISDTMVWEKLRTWLNEEKEPAPESPRQTTTSVGGVAYPKSNDRSQGCRLVYLKWSDRSRTSAPHHIVLSHHTATLLVGVLRQMIVCRRGNLQAPINRPMTCACANSNDWLRNCTACQVTKRPWPASAPAPWSIP